MATLILHDTYRMLEQEMKLIDKLRSVTAKEIQVASSFGDLKENYEYKAAKEEMELLMFKKELMQSHSPFQFVEHNEIGTDNIEFGNKILILEEGKNKPDEYYLLGPIEFELDIYPMIETYHSPFGKTIIGKKVNDTFTLEIKGKQIKFTIKSIEKIS